MNHLIHKMIYDGINGYLHKSCHPEQLSEAIISVHQNGLYWDSIPDDLLRSFSTKARNYVAISNTQQRFLSLLISGLTYDEIAKKMGIARSTVAEYKEALLEKFYVTTRNSLMVFAVQSGLLDLK